MRTPVITIAIILIAAYIFREDVLRLLMGNEAYQESLNTVAERKKQRAEAQISAALAQPDQHDLTGYQQAYEDDPKIVPFVQAEPDRQVFRTDPVIPDQEIWETDRAPYPERGECVDCGEEEEAEAIDQRVSVVYGSPTQFA